MADEKLTQEQLAALSTLAENSGLLLDLAQRAAERRARTGKATGEVTKHDWTAAEAKLHGLQNSMRSVLRAHDNSLAALRRAEAEAGRTGADVLMVRAQLEALIGAAE